MNPPVDYQYRGRTIRTYATPRADGKPDVVVLHVRGGVEYTAKDRADAGVVLHRKRTSSLYGKSCVNACRQLLEVKAALCSGLFLVCAVRDIFATPLLRFSDRCLSFRTDYKPRQSHRQNPVYSRRAPAARRRPVSPSPQRQPVKHSRYASTIS